MISSHVNISMISVTSGLSLKLYLNSLVYHRNIFESSSKVFGNLRQSSEMFGNVRKMFGKVRLLFGTILENLRKSSESGRKSSENHQKRRYQYVYKKNIIARTISHEWAQRTSEILFLPLEHKIHIFSPPCNILYLSSRSSFQNQMRTKLHFMLQWTFQADTENYWQIYAGRWITQDFSKTQGN